MRPLTLLLLSAALVAPGFATTTASSGSSSLPRASGASRGAAPSTVDQAYRVGPEDVIEIFVWKEPELSTTATVRPDGRITMPLAGEFEAAGKTADELQLEITESLKRYLSQPVVTVMVKAINSPQISVIGEIRKPGRYRIAQHATVLDAIALGGGFTEYARPQSVVVLRRTPSGVRRIPVDVRALLRNGNTPLSLEPGDTIYVE
jgi:polysaccharide export outer membrane protein